MNKERPLTVSEAAQYLSVHPWQIRYYINTGQLKAYKMGNSQNKRGSKRHWRIYERDIIAFLERGGNIREQK